MKKRLILLALCLTLLLAACGGPENVATTQPQAETASQAVRYEELLFEKVMPLSYATGFSVSYREEGYKLLTIG